MRNIRHLPPLKCEDLDMPNATFNFERQYGDLMVYSLEGCSHYVYVVSGRSMAYDVRPPTWEKLDMRTDAGKARMVELCLVAA